MLLHTLITANQIYFFKITYLGGDPSLEDVLKGMTPPMTPNQWHIHDPSRLVATDGLLMIADTGKENADGYK